MADNLIAILQELDDRIKLLTARNSALLAENESLREENQELKRKADAAEADRQRAALDAEYLAVSHKLADNPETLVQSRRHISQLIRNIDRCLEMLKE